MISLPPVNYQSISVIGTEYRIRNTNQMYKGKRGIMVRMKSRI
jgi:hypothetical protein